MYLFIVTSGTNIALVYPSQKISDATKHMKKDIKNKRDQPELVDIRLVYNGTKLKGDLTVSQSNITDGSKIAVERKLQVSVKIRADYGECIHFSKIISPVLD